MNHEWSKFELQIPGIAPSDNVINNYTYVYDIYRIIRNVEKSSPEILAHFKKHFILFRFTDFLESSQKNNNDLKQKQSNFINTPQNMPQTISWGQLWYTIQSAYQIIFRNHKSQQTT